jgi:membrane protein YdbS with pleckstrin-like domain
VHSLITPADERTPVTVNRYLLPSERKVILVRKHPAVLIRPIVFLILGLVLAGVLTEFVGVHNGWGALLIIWVLFLLDLFYFVYQGIQWWVSYFVVTSHRFLETSGLITRRVNLMPLAKVTDVVFERSFQGRLFGFGKLHLESAGQFQALNDVDHLPYPEQLYLEVCMLLFPGGAGEDPDDGWRDPDSRGDQYDPDRS